MTATAPALLGEAAAVGTAILWAACANAFGSAGRRVGSVAVNHVRLGIALGTLTLLHVLIFGTAWPSSLAPRDAMLFCASGVVGLTLGDASGFRALVIVGPAVVTLVFTLVPALASLLAWGFLGETLPPAGFAGMGLTIGGLALAVRTRTRGAGGHVAVTPLRPPGVETGSFGRGLVFAFGGALGQAGGIVLARPALAASSPLSGTWVRLAAATALLWTFSLGAALVRRKGPEWISGLRADRTALGLIALGAATGPVFGVWGAQVATKHAQVAVATTLMALTPIFVLLGEWIFTRRRPAGGEVAGAAIAILGVAVLVAARP